MISFDSVASVSRPFLSPPAYLNCPSRPPRAPSPTLCRSNPPPSEVFDADALSTGFVYILFVPRSLVPCFPNLSPCVSFFNQRLIVGTEAGPCPVTPSFSFNSCPLADIVLPFKMRTPLPPLRFTRSFSFAPPFPFPPRFERYRQGGCPLPLFGPSRPVLYRLDAGCFLVRS